MKWPSRRQHLLETRSAYLALTMIVPDSHGSFPIRRSRCVTGVGQTDQYLNANQAVEDIPHLYVHHVDVAGTFVFVCQPSAVTHFQAAYLCPVDGALAPATEPRQVGVQDRPSYGVAGKDLNDRCP